MITFGDFSFGDYNAGDLLWLGDWSPAWITMLVVLGTVIFAISAYDLRNLRALRRWTLVGLRVAVYALAVLLLLEPAIDLKHISKVKNDVVVMVDTSKSMGLRAEADSEGTRYQRATEALDGLKPLIERGKEDHNFHYFSVGDGLRPSSLTALQAATPSADATEIGLSFDALTDHIDPQNLGGMILISDGIDTGALGRRIQRGEELDQATLETLKNLDAPLNTLAAASAESLRDLAITRVHHDDFAYIHNKVSIDVDLQIIGLNTPTVQVELRREGQLLQTRQLQISPDTTEYRVSFELVPEHMGKEIYTVAAPEYPGEVLTENNISHFLLNVIRDKIRVLQVVGQPSWDERFMRRLLKNNPNYDLISFFILRTDSSVQLVPNNEMSLIPFPTRELFEDELGSFDMVIFQNFNFGPYQMRRYLPRIAEFVREGGGFVMIGGELSFAAGGYSNTPIEEILPVFLPPMSNVSGAVNFDEFQPELTRAGLYHPITQLAFDPASNLKIWSQLPGMRGSNIVTGAKPGATVLATHPTLRAGGEPMPVITVSEVGKGRSMAITSDSTWRWAFEQVDRGGVGREYQVFWNSAIRWLIQDPELKLIRVEVPENIYPPGSEVDVLVHLAKSDYTPAVGVEGTLQLLHRDLVDPSHKAIEGHQGARPTARQLKVPDKKTIQTIPFTTNARGEAILKLPVPKTGVYELIAEAPGAAGKLVDRESFLALQNINEFREIIPRDPLLSDLASASGGYHAALPKFSPDSVKLKPPRFVKVNHRRVIQLWDHFAIFFLILGLLAAEWSLRRRWGRL
ncbi:glutamine amidotransferase [Bradymonas sediminis]|uniref:Uncharacterized protein n=1 Tax=Bradymonas sediminis TaxID=1548548 RepID=A0A2Z4FJP3_9DELT|nr:glutamine amidotransferase [Bradymonas sediminis]AWV89090.1 hypothetical protein DN745_06970 [Bradymonas sediminis]TDP64446.1 putative glutamine amidotransferase [Bradymonas sediminis]